MLTVIREARVSGIKMACGMVVWKGDIEGRPI
jgi:hypothetical protein